MDFLNSNPNTSKTYRKSKIILKIHSNSSYLSINEARSAAAGHFYLGDN